MSETTQRPTVTVIFAAIGYTLIPVVALSLAGVAAGVADSQGHPLSANATMAAQIAAMIISIGVGILLAKRYGGLCGIGVRRPHDGWLAKIWWLAPVVAVEAVAFLAGLDLHGAGVPLLLLALFCVVVGCHEELYFRGLVTTCLRRFGWRIMAVVSALLFGVGHAAQAMSGTESSAYVAIQIVFAILFGVVALEIVVLTGSLWPVIVWHAVHDFIAQITVNSVTGMAGVACAVQGVILLATAIAWWKPANQQLQ